MSMLCIFISEPNHVWLFVLDDCASFLQGEPYYGAFSSTVNATEVKMCENLLAFMLRSPCVSSLVRWLDLILSCE